MRKQIFGSSVVNIIETEVKAAGSCTGCHIEIIKTKDNLYNNCI